MRTDAQVGHSLIAKDENTMDARVLEQSTRCPIATYQSDHSLRVTVVPS